MDFSVLLLCFASGLKGSMGSFLLQESDGGCKLLVQKLPDHGLQPVDDWSNITTEVPPQCNSFQM